MGATDADPPGAAARTGFSQMTSGMRALIDTACGFAAVTSAGSRVLAAHFSAICLRPAVGERFVARARLVRLGRSQVFTCCELFAESDGQERLVVTGGAIPSVPPME